MPERLSSTQRFNDLSAAGEWSHSNILFWLVLCRAPPPPRAWLTWFWLAPVPPERRPANPIILTRSGWLPPWPEQPREGPVESNSMRQKNELLRPRGTRCHIPCTSLKTLSGEEGQAGSVNVTNEAVGNTRAVFSDKLNSLHAPEFHSAYAM